MRQTKPVLHGRDHLPGGADPMLPMWPTGDTIGDKILAALPAGFWKLNEDSGSIAADSSGNEQDLSTSGSVLDPVWGQEAGPPGEQSASFDVGSGPAGTASRVSRPWPTITGSFTAGIWVNRTSEEHSFVMGQVGPGGATSSGWELQLLAYNFTGAENLPAAIVSASGADAELYALNPLLPGTWVMLALVYDADLDQAKLYVDGLLNDTSGTFTFVPAVGTNPELYVGHIGQLQFGRAQMVGSYAFLVNRAMSGDELLGITAGLAEGDTSDTDGLVLTIDEDGDVGWEPPTVEIEHGGGEPDEADVTGPAGSGSVSASGWHLSAHVESAVLYDANPARFDVPPRTWTRVPFDTVRFWRTWETAVGGNTKSAWLPDDRGLTDQARKGILHVASGMTFDPLASGDGVSLFGWFSIEWPVLDPLRLPNEPETGLDAYVRAGRYKNLSTGSVIRAEVGSSLRRFFEWQMPDTADGTPEWVDYSTDNPYPIYPIWAPRPLRLPDPYPHLGDALGHEFYEPRKTFGMNTRISVGDNLCMEVWQDSPWLLRFSTDTFEAGAPTTPSYTHRPHLALTYEYDPETIDHDTGAVL